MLKILSTCAVVCLFPGMGGAGVPQIVTDLPPVHALVSLVTGDLAAPVLLMDEPGDGHGFALRPSQAAALGRADLAIWTGPDMAPWMARALDSAKTESLPLLAAPGTRLRGWGSAPQDGGQGHDHAEQAEGHAHDDHAHDDHDGHDHEDHDHDHHHDYHDHDHAHGATDPHAWLEPANALYWLDLIARRLSVADPANADAYAGNARAASSRIRALDAELRNLLTPLAGRPFVLGHDAYGYFTAHYGLQVAGTLAAGDGASPGAAHLSALRAQLQQEGVVCAFPEVGQSPRLLETVVEGSSVKIGAALDPAGAALDKGPGLYEALLRDLAQKLGDCLAR